MKVKDLLHEIDWALDSILPIEERVVEQKGVFMVMKLISQLRGHLLTVRDRVVVENNVIGRKELYHPLESLTLEGMRILYKDMPDNLAEKHFDQSAYRKHSKYVRGCMVRGGV